MFPLYFIIVYFNGKNYLMCGDPGCATAFKTKREAIDYFEKPWQEAHSRSYERSMSACLNMIAYNPCIVRINSEAMFDALFENRDDTIYMKLSSASGNMNAVVIKQDVAESMREHGSSPKLIDETVIY